MNDLFRAPKSRRGLWRALGAVLRGPVDVFNPRQVAEGAQTINMLAMPFLAILIAIVFRTNVGGDLAVVAASSGQLTAA